jgi:antitoxin VapB
MGAFNGGLLAKCAFCEGDGSEDSRDTDFQKGFVGNAAAALIIYPVPYIYIPDVRYIMAYSIKDPATDRIIRQLAKAKGKPILDSIREACENELKREYEKIPLWQRLQPLVRRVAAAPKTGLRADKAFFDDLSGDEK